MALRKRVYSTYVRTLGKYENKLLQQINVTDNGFLFRHLLFYVTCSEMRCFLLFVCERNNYMKTFSLECNDAILYSQMYTSELDNLTFRKLIHNLLEF